MKKIFSSKKAQFWYGDFLIAVLILIVIGLLFVVSMRDITSRNEVLKDLIMDASDISSTLMGEGYGMDEWDENQGAIGLITDYEFDNNKWESFSGPEGLEENQQRVMLGTLNNVWIYLKSRDGVIIKTNLEDVESIENIEADNLVHIQRFVFYEGDIYTLGVVVW